MDGDSMTVGRMGLKPVHTEEGNMEGKCKKLSRKMIQPDLLVLKFGEGTKSIVRDSGRTEELGLFGNNVRMERDGMDAEDGSMSRMRLLVGTVQDEGKLGECSATTL